MGHQDQYGLNPQFRVVSIFIKTDQSPYEFQHLAARFDSAINKWSLPD